MQPYHLKAIKQILAQNPSVVFAYFYGSSKDSKVYNDIDIAVFSTLDSESFRLSVDLKIVL
jgi:predicted nucleotidyltransferase